MMNEKFVADDAGVVMRLDDVDETILRDMHQILRQSLLSDDITDPVLHRLFPVPVIGDDVVAGDVQQMITSDLRESRLESLDTLDEILERGRQRSSGGLEVRLADDETHLMLGILNDLRLALGARIGIDHLERAQLEPGDARLHGLAVIDHLAWLQEQLLRIIDPEAMRYADEVGEDADS